MDNKIEGYGKDDQRASKTHEQTIGDNEVINDSVDENKEINVKEKSVDENQLMNKKRIEELNKNSIKQLKDSLFINQVLASVVEILGETHLTKSEKYKVIKNLNEASTLDGVKERAKTIKETFNLDVKSQNFKEENQEDDSFWSKGFVEELETYYNIYKGVNVKKTLSTSIVEIDNYFKLLTLYAQNQDNPDKIPEITEKILEQEPKSREAIENLKTLSYTLDKDIEEG